MTHARNYFSFRICGVFRLAVYFSIFITPLFFSSNAESGPAYDALKNQIDNVIAKDSSRWTVDKYKRGDLKISDVKPISKGRFEVRGIFYHTTWFGARSSKDFTCTMKSILDSVEVESCCWSEPHVNQWCTQ